MLPIISIIYLIFLSINFLLFLFIIMSFSCYKYLCSIVQKESGVKIYKTSVDNFLLLNFSFFFFLICNSFFFKCRNSNNWYQSCFVVLFVLYMASASLYIFLVTTAIRRDIKFMIHYPRR